MQSTSVWRFTKAHVAEMRDECAELSDDLPCFECYMEVEERSFIL
jgi:hypothetical protein